MTDMAAAFPVVITWPTLVECPFAENLVLF